LFSGRPLVKTYIASEIVFFIPTLFFTLLIAVVNMSPSHGFSAGELLFPILVLVIFSIVPLGLAVWLAWKLRFKGEVKIFE
jgi:hypothetical protein